MTIANGSPTIDIPSLDPYQFMTVIGKRVIHPGSRRSSEEVFALAAPASTHVVLDVGCGVGTSAIAIAHRFGAHVTAIDISPFMLKRATVNVRDADLGNRVVVEWGDIRALSYSDRAFDRIFADAVTMFVDRRRAATELLRVCKPGGRLLATEFFWRTPPTVEARQIFWVRYVPVCKWTLSASGPRSIGRLGWSTSRSASDPSR
ncbi:MAG: hypothetical protein NVS4B2_24660 [Chloroflexota bacterium]